MRLCTWFGTVFSFLVCLAAGLPVRGQEPAEYQVIRVRFRLLGTDGRPVAQASMCARLDPQSSRLPPDRTLRAKTGSDEYAYTLDDGRCEIFSMQQNSVPDGTLELPLIVYANRAEPIDYSLHILYGKERHNRIFDRDIRRGFSTADAGTLTTITINVVPPVPATNYVIAGLAWIAATLMGALLFFRGVYKSLLASGKSIDLSRALCWSGVLLVCVIALGLVYWVWLPHVVNMYLLFGFLMTIWVVHLLFTVVPKRA